MISTIITTYGGGSQLQRAVDSVLAQTYKDIEVIVVDDNNPDTDARQHTEEVMLKYESDPRVKYLKHEKNKNGAAARNTGIRAAVADYISFLDDDDYYFPERFERILNVMNATHDLVGIITGVNLQDENDVTVMAIRPKQELDVRELLLNEMALGTGSNIFVKSDVIGAVKGFDESFVRRQDIEFMIRVCEYGKVGFVEDCLVIKSVNGIANHPKYERMKLVIDQFANKFEKQVGALGEEKNGFYCTQYRTLFGIALYEHNPVEIKEAIGLIRKYGKLTVKERVLAFVYIHNLRDNKIFKTAISVKNRIKAQGL